MMLQRHKSPQTKATTVIAIKVLVNDGMNPEGIEIFQKAGISVDDRRRKPDELGRAIGGFDALTVRSSTKVTKQVIEAGASGNLKIIGRQGVGFDNIDVEAASQKGIIVKTAPYGNTNAVAELVIGLMLNVSRRISKADHTLKNGKWSRRNMEGYELSGKTVGLLGCGRIAQRLSRLLSGFGAQVIGYDIALDKVREAFPDSRIKYVSKEEVLRADYISLHTGGNATVVGEKEIALMKPNAIIINTSRGQNIDESALYQALKIGKIAGAGLDVYAEEPESESTDFVNKLRGLDNVVLTPHLGASTKEAQMKTSIEIARIVVDYLLKGDFSNSVNVGETVEMEEKQVYPLFIHHLDVPGAFAQIDGKLGEYKINIRENRSREIGTGHVLTVYLVHQLPSKEALAELKKLDIVLRVAA
ncbi:MAG: hydroxyacid dehydrogenase [Thaumarchaeota archaeon]|nr:hydroxyacid dehydrogenase [Nitrososphaerota archaeon]